MAFTRDVTRGHEVTRGDQSIPSASHLRLLRVVYMRVIKSDYLCPGRGHESHDIHVA